MTAGHHAAMMIAPPATQGSSAAARATAQPHAAEDPPAERRAPHDRAGQRRDLDRRCRRLRQQLEQIDPEPEQQRDHRRRRRLIAQRDKAVAETSRRPEPPREPRPGHVQQRQRGGERQHDRDHPEGNQQEVEPDENLARLGMHDHQPGRSRLAEPVIPAADRPVHQRQAQILVLRQDQPQKPAERDAGAEKQKPDFRSRRMMAGDVGDLGPRHAQMKRETAGFVRADAARAHHAMPALGLAPQIDHRRAQPARIIGVAAFLRPFRHEIDRAEPREHAEQQPDRAGMPAPRALASAPARKNSRRSAPRAASGRTLRGSPTGNRAPRPSGRGSSRSGNSTIGVPSQRSQAGTGRFNPMPFIHSEAAPIGHSTPHQLRPVTSTDRKTSGNHRVQIRKRAVCPIACATALAGTSDRGRDQHDKGQRHQRMDKRQPGAQRDRGLLDAARQAPRYRTARGEAACTGVICSLTAIETSPWTGPRSARRDRPQDRHAARQA